MLKTDVVRSSIILYILLFRGEAMKVTYKKIMAPLR